MTSSPQPADGTWAGPAAEPTEPSPGDTREDGPADDASGDGRRRRPLRASLITLAALTVVAAGGVGATGVLGGDGGESAEAAPSRPAKSAAVEKTTLTRGETVDGALGYGEATTVQAPAGGGSGQSGGTGTQNAQGTRDGQGARDGQGTRGSDTGAGSGTVTWLPDVGDEIERGESVYSADERKSVLLYGSTPLYRTLGVGSEGKDVTMLERNLAALGHTGFTVDAEYTESTADAVRAWQKDLGRAETGEVSPGDAVVASGARRVAEVRTARGAALGGDVLTWTGTGRVVTVDLEVRLEGLVKNGTKAAVALPDGTVVDAEVTDIGAAATAAPSEGGEETSAEDAILPVELTVKDQKKLGRYQAAPVDVTLTAESRADVLAVPVDALIARQGGGYAVQVVTEDGAENRPVELGLFADGLVEVSGTGITEGLRVGVPQ
ncbi:peptidoglycan-binding protein [Streptomyces sp. NPDC006645]|uniref:peptidoglycan-binding protein n=1 Tax=unclassified Streptomyces TaxID=2593676 RepID=UPI0033A30B51